MLRPRSDKELAIAEKLSMAIELKLMKEAELAYDELADAMIESGATVSEMVGFGMAKALTLHRLETDLDNHTSGMIH